MTFFLLVIDQVFQILRFFTVLNVVYDPFFTGKTTILENNSLIRPFSYSVHPFARVRQHYFSKYWGGTNAWAVLHLKFGETVPQSPQVSAPEHVSNCSKLNRRAYQIPSSNVQSKARR